MVGALNSFSSGEIMMIDDDHNSLVLIDFDCEAKELIYYGPSIMDVIWGNPNIMDVFMRSILRLCHSLLRQITD